MKFFQNISLYSNYLPRIEKFWNDSHAFAEMVDHLVRDRFGGVHYLKPVLEKSPDSFFTAGDNVQLQKKWAAEHGLPTNSSLDEILCAQIENHGSEVFYNMDPVRYDNRFLKKLPGCIRRTIAWRAAPSGNAQFLEHDIVVNNYPSLAKQYEKQGARTEFFFPAHDPAMDSFQQNTDRPIDILFIGGYSRHHQERARTLDTVSQLAGKYNIVFNLDVSRMTKLAETPIGWFGPLTKYRRPSSIREVTRPPVFGLDMYRQISQAKVVINGKVDIAGSDRGNMRLWETLGCGAALITDEGNYPASMKKNVDFEIYSDDSSLSLGIESLLENDERRLSMAQKGHKMISSSYSKSKQWERFITLCQ